MCLNLFIRDVFLSVSYLTAWKSASQALFITGFMRACNRLGKKKLYDIYFHDISLEYVIRVSVGWVVCSCKFRKETRHSLGVGKTSEL